MPDADGRFKGTGWSRTYDDAWDRVFGNAASQQPRAASLEWLPSHGFRICCGGLGPCTTCPRVPHERTPEVIVDRSPAPRATFDDDPDDWTPEDYDQRRSAR